MMFMIKELTVSDITIVREVWERLREAGFKGKQMAIVLPRELMRNEGYDFIDYERGFELDLDISFYGPDASSGLRYEDSAICRHSKDWRIHKCYIKPEHYAGEPGRFDALEPGDIFVLNADMTCGPVFARGCFISSAASEDGAAYRYLCELNLPILRRPESLAGALEEAGVPPIHPLFDVIGCGSGWSAGDAGESSSGVSENLPDPWDHASAAGGEFALTGNVELSQEELDARLAEARRIGELGEHLVNSWLTARPLIGRFRVISHEWIARDNAVSPYDFRVALDDGSWRDIEVKTTSGAHAKALYISRGELHHMAAANNEDVILARISHVDEQPQMRLATETTDAALLILDSITLPEGVGLVSVSVQPDYFQFGEALIPLGGPGTAD